MTPEQRIFWDTLKCDAHWFAHDRARILSSLDAELFIGNSTRKVASSATRIRSKLSRL